MHEVSINYLSEKDWNEMVIMAHTMYKAGMYGGEMSKCMVYAFIQWMMVNDVNVYIEEEMLPNGAH